MIELIVPSAVRSSVGQLRIYRGPIALYRDVEYHRESPMFRIIGDL